MAEFCINIKETFAATMFLTVFGGFSNAQIKNSEDTKQDLSVIITGNFDKKETIDSVTLLLWRVIISEANKSFTPVEQITSIVREGHFVFKIDSVENVSYLSLANGNQRGIPIPFLDLYLVSPGDSIHINIQNRNLDTNKKVISKADNGKSICGNCNNYTFSGKGFYKYQCRYELDRIVKEAEDQWNKKSKKPTATLMDQAIRHYDLMSHVTEEGNKFLMKNKSNLNANIFNLLKADMLGIAQDLFFHGMMNVFMLTKNNRTSSDKDAFLQFYIDRFLFLKHDVPPDILAVSAKYPSMLLNKIRFENELLYHGNIYSLIKDKYNGKLRDRLLSNYLVDNTVIVKVDSLLKDAITFVRDDSYRNVLINILDSRKIGTRAYNFSLPDSSGKMVNLSDFKGKIVFIDFWFTGCGGCIQYYKSCVSKAEESLKDNLDIVFITIAVDGNKEKWISGLKSGNYTSALAINLYTADLGVAHPLIKQLNVKAYPHPIIIDRHGNILVNDEDRLRKGGPEKLIRTINEAMANN